MTEREHLADIIERERAEAVARAEAAEKRCVELEKEREEYREFHSHTRKDWENEQSRAKKAEKRCAELAAQVERLQSRTECSGREVDLTDPDDACQSARVHFARAERAEAACAQMRAIIERARQGCACLTWQVGDIDAALASDVGAIRALKAKPGV